MTAFGDYEQSYPPEILRGYEPPLVGATARLSASTGGTIVVAAGEPGTYEPELTPRERPRNVTELRERARPVDTAAWPVGAYVLVGTSGKRAHWGGDDWHSDESPGYAEESASDEPDDGPEVSEVNLGAPRTPVEPDDDPDDDE